MLGLEFADPADLAPRPDLTLGVMEAAKARGLLVGRGGLHGNVIRMAPPMSLTSEEAGEGFRLFSAAVRDTVG
jgi:4-aminobutyrate aminotransferase-like enzyme